METQRKVLATLLIWLSMMIDSSYAESDLDAEIGQLIKQFEEDSVQKFNYLNFTDLETRACTIKTMVDDYHNYVKGILERPASYQMNHSSQIRLKTLEFILQNAKDLYKYRRISDYRPHVINRMFRWMFLQRVNERNAADVIQLLERLPSWLNTSIALLSEELQNGNVMDQKSFDDFMNLVEWNQPESPEYHLQFLWNLFQRNNFHFRTDESRELFKKGTEMVQSTVIPAYAKFRDFVCNEYAKVVASSISLSVVPGGREYYAALARASTTTTLTPEEIHDIGRREIARIKDEMNRIKKREGFNGTLDQFIEHIQNQTQLYFDYVDNFKAAVTMTEKLVREKSALVLKSDVPQPAKLEFISDPVATLAGYRDNVIFVNMVDLQNTLKTTILPVLLHEGSPGHYSQDIYPTDIEGIQLLTEKSLPLWPAPWPHFTAYVEGWGLYSEALGEDMGLYKTSMQKFARYTYEMLRSVRLVIDTGVHYYGWTLEEAADFVHQHAKVSDYRARNEADRVRIMPGQVLGYKIGEMKIAELRERAEKILGEDFDLREFHHQILRTGPVPLGVLEEHINHWMNRPLLAAYSDASKTSEAITVLFWTLLINSFVPI